MNPRSRVDLALTLVFATVAALLLPKLLWPEASFYQQGFTQQVLAWVAALPKLCSLVLGAVLAARIAQTFERRSAMRAGWWLVATWMGTWAVGQGILGVFTLLLGRDSPFPSPADVFFVVGYPAMLAAFWLFIRGYTATGMLGGAREHAITAAIAGLAFLLLGVMVLRPVLRAGGAPLELALNIAYPAFDIVALVPTIVLARMAWRMAGGALFWVWGAVSAGIVFLVAADLLYGWFSLLDFGTLDPLLDVFYVAGYMLVARGIYQQHRVSVGVSAATSS